MIAIDMLFELNVPYNRPIYIEIIHRQKVLKLSAVMAPNGAGPQVVYTGSYTEQLEYDWFDFYNLPRPLMKFPSQSRSL